MIHGVTAFLVQEKKIVCFSIDISLWCFNCPLNNTFVFIRDCLSVCPSVDTTPLTLSWVQFFSDCGQTW